MNVNQIAFCTATGLGVATIGSVVAAATTASTVACVAYSILGVAFGGASIASVTAHVKGTATNAQEYFTLVGEHAGYAIAGLTQLFAQAAVQGIIQGVTQGIAKAFTRMIAGEDVTIRHRYS